MAGACAAVRGGVGGGPGGLGLGAAAARRQARQTVDFSLKGAVHVTLDEMPVGPPGCSVVDLMFNTPSQVSELVFHNYYTAWLTVLVRMLVAAPGPGSACTAPSPASEHGPHGPQGAGVGTTAAHDGDQAPQAQGSQGAVGDAVAAMPPQVQGLQGLQGHGHAQADAGGKARKESGWVVAVARRVLMPSPHLEAGSHDFVSILATESAVPWTELMAMRLVLRQPSPSWHTFHVEEIHVFAEPPRRALWSRRGQPLGQPCPPPPSQPLHAAAAAPASAATAAQSAAAAAAAATAVAADQNAYDSILALLRHQTQAALRSSVSTSGTKTATPTRARQIPAYEINSLPPV